MEESAKKSTRVSNLEKMSPEKRAKWDAFVSDEFGQLLVDNLKRGIEENDEKWKRLMEGEQRKKDQAEGKG
jgi:hypothetical protein